MNNNHVYLPHVHTCYIQTRFGTTHFQAICTNREFEWIAWTAFSRDADTSHDVNPQSQAVHIRSFSILQVGPDQHQFPLALHPELDPPAF